MVRPHEWHPATLEDVRDILGEPDASFTLDWTYLWVSIFTATGSSAFGIILLSGVLDNALGFDFVKCFLGIPLAVGGLFALGLISRSSDLRLILYPQSLIVRSHRQITVMPWSSIVEVSHTGDSEGTVVVSRRDEPSISFRTDIVKNAQDLYAYLGFETRRNGIPSSFWHEMSSDVRGRGSRVHQMSMRTIQSSVDLSVFGEQVARALESAEVIARKLFHDCLATEHVLLALLEAAPNDATVALHGCGVLPGNLKHRLKAIVTAGAAEPTEFEKLPQTPRLIGVFVEAEKEARRFGGCLALFLALVRDQEGIAGMALSAEGLNEIDLRKSAGLTTASRIDANPQTGDPPGGLQ